MITELVNTPQKEKETLESGYAVNPAANKRIGIPYKYRHEQLRLQPKDSYSVDTTHAFLGSMV
jgi:hypothetical protein